MSYSQLQLPLLQFIPIYRNGMTIDRKTNIGFSQIAVGIWLKPCPYTKLVPSAKADGNCRMICFLFIQNTTLYLSNDLVAIKQMQRFK